MTLEHFDNTLWKSGIPVICYGRGKEQHLTVLNVDLIKRKILTEKGLYHYKNVEIPK